MWWFNWVILRCTGARPRRLRPGGRADIASIDGLVIGGGDDIDAELYGGTIEPAIRIDKERDAFELRLLQTAKERRLPVLGICRGAQMINVFFGGRLHEDIYAAYADIPRVRSPLPSKTITVTSDTLLRSLLRHERVRVNALHHQSIDTLGEGLQVVARDEHGIVQAIERRAGSFLLGVQWHPEFMILHAGQRRLFRALVAAARGSDGHEGDEEIVPVSADRYQGSSSPS